ncbi:MAG: vanadium-dependent haloperoxidase [Caldilineaceae bacterium]
MVIKLKLLMLEVGIAVVLLALCLGITQQTAAGQNAPATDTSALTSLTVGATAADDNAVVHWDKITLNAIRISRPGPPMVARMLAMVHTAQYEAWSQYEDSAVGTLLGAQFRRPAAERTTANQSEAMNYAAYRVASDLFPSLRSLFDAEMRALGYTQIATTTNPALPAGMGNLAAAVLLTYRHDDGANQLGDRHPGAYTDYTGYQPLNSPDHVADINHWQPLKTPNGTIQVGCVDSTELVTQTYVGPHWGNVIPFALDDGETITPTTGPAIYPSTAFTLQAEEIISLSANLTDRQKVIAEYWADGPASELPPGHWLLFSQFVSQRDQHTLADDAKLFFAVSNANLDAGIMAWKLKRIYDSVRPITAIQELFRGKPIEAWAGPYSGTKTISGEQWIPYQPSCFVSPAFPEYLSGHSSFSAASAEVLRSFTGSDFFGDSEHFAAGESRTEPGLVPATPLTLTWPTFTDAANEAGMSRRYGGIHFERGDLDGRMLGRKVGERVWQKALTFFNGSGAPVAALDQAITRILALDNYDLIFLNHHAYFPYVARE